jgi:hypothetical protein
MTTESKKSSSMRLTYTHDAMVDLILQDPTVTPSELAALFGYSAGWIQRVVSSDSFQSRIAERKAALIDPIIARSLNERLRTMAIQSVDIINDKLAAEQSASYAIDALGLATQAMGFTQRKGS